MEKPLILIVAGDPSGDLHGAALARALQAGGARVAAVGGPHLREACDEFLEDLASRSITGFWEPVAKIGYLLRLGLRLKRYLLACRPAALVCVDYYGFNRRILPLARNAGVPAWYFISPQVWASRPGRVRMLKRFVARMLVIFPFEEALYRKAGVPVTFVGHPLLDRIPEPREKDQVSPPFTIGLLPGSRDTEVRRHLPVFLKALSLIQGRFPGSRGLLFTSPHLPEAAYARARGAAELVRDAGYERRSVPDLVITSSGTATLENALLGIPMVVVYKMSWPTYAVARAIVKVKHIAMANLLAGRRVVPELIQHDATAERVAGAALAILSDPSHHAAIRRELLAVRRALGRPGAAQRAAAEILASLRAPA